MITNLFDGIAKGPSGNVQERAGEIVGFTSEKIMGVQDQVSSKTREKLGDVRESSRDAARRSLGSSAKSI